MHNGKDFKRRLAESLVCLLVFISPLCANAQTTLKLFAEPSPENNTIYIPSELKNGIRVYAEISGKWRQLNWKFSGPGQFRNTEFGAFYLPPEELQEAPAAVLLIATLIPHKGETIEERLEWTLMTSPPTPTPSPAQTSTPPPTPTPAAASTPTPEPTSTPSPTPEPNATPSPTPEPTTTPTPVPSLSELHMHLQAANRYVAQKAYTTPEGQNAFDAYKAALELDPTSRKARQGIYKILQKYKLWGDDEYEKGNTEDARKAYKRYLTVAGYLLETFGDTKLEEEVQGVKERLQ